MSHSLLRTKQKFIIENQVMKTSKFNINPEDLIFNKTSRRQSNSNLMLMFYYQINKWKLQLWTLKTFLFKRQYSKVHSLKIMIASWIPSKLWNSRKAKSYNIWIHSNQKVSNHNCSIFESIVKLQPQALIWSQLSKLQTQMMLTKWLLNNLENINLRKVEEFWQS